MSTSSTAVVSDKVSETEFLSEQAAAAKTRAFAALDEAKNALLQKVDPREKVKQHPWMTIAAAAGAGLVAALVTIPSKKESELRRLERLNRALHPPAPQPPPSNNGAAQPKQAPQTTFWGTVLHEVIQLIRPTIMTLISAGVRSAMNPQPEDSPAPRQPL